MGIDGDWWGLMGIGGF